MDMSVSGEGSPWRRLRSPTGFTAVSHVYVMEWAAILRDIVIGLLAAGASRPGYRTRGGSRSS